MATDTLSNHEAHANEHEHHDAGSTTVFGFWIYLMSDLVIFGALFATYAVLVGGTADGPTPQEVFELPLILLNTFLLLFSSFTFGMAVLAMNANRLNQVKAWLAVTFVLGAGFIGLELYEFQNLIHEGYGPDRSGFLSGFFTLVGTHGLHVSIGLIWILVMIVQVSTKGLTPTTRSRIMCLSLFWHFLDIVWICVFTFVYLMGVL